MAKYISERDKRVKEREHLYRQAGLLTSADGKSERARVVEEQSKQYADAIMPPKPLTPAERYAQSRINNTSSDRRLNAMEQRLDPGTNVRTTYGAKREWEKDTDAVISARDKVNNQPVTAAMTGGDNPWAGLFSSNTRQNTTNYAKVAEEYRKKYGIESEDEFNNALEYRAAENAQRQAEHKEAKKKVPYTKYENLSDDDKALVARTYGDGTGHANDYTNWRNPNLKAVPLTRSEAKEKLREKYTDEEIKELQKGYKASSKYGTPITEDKELATKYAYLDGRAKELIANIPIDTANEVEDLFVEATRKELRDNYNLTDDEITQLSVYARRKSDANTGNKEFWSEAGKEAAKDDKALASVASIGSNMVSNVTSPLGILRDVAENRALKNAGYKGDTTLNKDNPLYAMRNYTQGIRGQRAEDLNEAWGTDKVAGFIYQTAMSGADSLMAMSIGSLFPAVNFGGTINGVKNTISLGAAATNAAYSMGMGGLMLGMGAGVDTMLDLTEKGASAETAVMGGLVSGTFEMLFEDLSISELSTFKGIEALEMAKGWSKQAVKQNVKIAAEKILGSAVTNASEEGLTELANLIYDTLANGDMSQYAEYYNNAIASGMSTDEARKEAFKDMALQVLEAAAGGALMGVGFGVGGAVKLNAQRNTTYAMSPDGLVPVTPKMKGRAISASGRVGETLQAADVVGGTAQEYKDQLIDKAGGSSNLTEKEIGKIALETQFATEGNEEKRKALKSFREEAEVKRANYKQGATENGNKTRYLITNSPITVDGKETTINGNNKVDTEGEVFTDGKNGLEFKTGDGRTVELTRQTASQIKNEDARNLALFAVNNSLKAKSANLLFNTYDGEFLAGDHASAFLNIYRQGSLGTKNKALIKNYSESLSKFTADQVNEIMNAGLEEKKFTPGATDFRVSEKKNNFVNLQVKIMDSIAKALNKELIVTDDLFDEYTREDGTKGYRALNGTYIKGDNRIILSAKADNGLLLSFLAHEMGHEMKNTDSDAFGRLKEKVKSYYTPEEFEEMKAEFVLKGYAESEAEEEIIANALFKVWDKDTIKKVVGKNKSLAVKLYNLVDKISKTYDKAIQRFTTGTDRYGNARNADVKKLIDNKQYMDDVKKVFTEYIDNMQNGKYEEETESASPEFESTQNFSIADKETSARLDAEEYVTTYRAMALIDGKLYPPMATYMGQKKSEMKLVDGAELNDWITADEFPEYVKDGKFPLNKEVWNDEKGKWEMKTIWAAYNPYMHSSNVVLNDQFSSAYKRPNIVTVECRVPVSELTSGYWADQAKDATGWHDWKAGKVAGKIAQQKDFKRQVLLSRWIKPVRIVPDAEVARLYKEYLKDTDVSVPDNVVTPGLLKELKNIGVPITESGLLTRDSDYIKAVNDELNKNGIAVDGNTGAAFSVRYTLDSTDFDEDKIARDLSNATGRTIKEAKEWLKAERSLAAMIVEHPEYLDFDPDDRYQAIKENSDYPQGTVDLSNLCPKRVEFTTMFDMLQKMYPNKLFTAKDVAQMRDILKKNGVDVACGICFVEDRRQKSGEIAEEFIDMWKESVKSGSPLTKKSGANLKVTEDAAKQYGLEKGSLITADDKYIPTQYDLTTYEGYKSLTQDHPSIARAFENFNNSRGQQAARLIEGRAEYKRQILSWSDAKVKKVNDVGGLRIFSFSDFETPHLLDLVQVITDCAARGVKIQGYTKRAEFARLVSNTGIKLNRSLIPAGDTGLELKNGKWVLTIDNVEGINTKDKNYLDERDNPNIGNIIIGINDKQIGVAMLDDNIDYIIPFHTNKSGDILKELNIAAWENYKYYQAEKDIKTGKRTTDVNIYTDVIQKYNPKNKVEFVNAFIEECKKQGKIPRFSQFLNVDENGNYTYREGYHKLLLDFKMFDREGNILPQGNVTPNFDLEYMKELLQSEVEKKSDYKFPQKVFDEIVDKFGENKNSISNREYVSEEDSDGNRLTTEQEGFFEKSKIRDENGNLLVVYHGTDEDFTVFDKTKGRSTMDIQGMFFSPWEIDAGGYGQNVGKYYLNITNPAPEDVAYKALNMYKGQNNAGVKAREYLEKLGYDGVNNGNEEYIAFNSNQIKRVDNLNPTENEDVRYSLSDRNLDGYEGYDEDITTEDIEIIQRIAKEKNKPSIKQLSDSEIKATRKWAYRFRHLKEKSPFFRAWFGEWRALDESEVTTSHSDKNIAPTNGREYNRDTEQYISWGKQLRGETRIKYGLDSDEYHFVRNIDKIIKNAVLLDTRLSFTDSNSKMKNTEFFHWFYAVCDDKNGNPCVVRLSVEQAFNNQMTDEFVRGYEVHQIKKVAELHLSVLAENSGLTQQSTTITNVAQLYDFVKKNEKKFVPGKEVSKKLFDKDTNKPKVFYHGTASDFDTFNMSEGAYGKGAYFTTSTAEAADYAIGQLEAKGIEVPEDYDDIEDWLFENGYIREYYLNVPEDQIFSSKYGSDELVAMITDPSQAKSATDNIGTYNRFNSNTKLSLSERGDIDEYEAEQLLDTAKGEDAKAIVDAVDRELLGDAMYYGRKAEQLRDEKNAAKKEAKSLNSKVETRNRQIAALRQKVKDQKLADDIYYQRRIHEIREDRDQKILALKAARRQQDINRRENKLVRDYRSRIQKTYDNLSKELLKPNANRYVPAGLVKTVSDVLGTLSDTLQTTDYYTQGSREGQEIKSRVARNKRLADLKVSYDSLANDKNYSQVYDPVISDMIQVMNETIGDKTIEEMNAKELEQVYTVLKAIDHTVRKAAKVEIAGREADAFKVADKSIDQLKEVKKKKINFITKFWYEQLNPYSFFRQLSGYTDGGWMDTYELLNNGQLKQTEIKAEITEAFRELTGDKRARELMDTDKLVDVGLKDAHGNTIPITRGMMISLYMHLQNEDNTRHIEYGGLSVPEINLYYKGKKEAWGTDVVQSAGASAELRSINMRLEELQDRRKDEGSSMALDAKIEELEAQREAALERADILSENLRLNIEKELTDYDRAWIEKAKWLFDEYSKNKLNEATMRMYGFRKANVENYMPIRTDETDIAPTFEGVKRDVSLENSGFMKNRQQGASNAIYLEDIVDVIQRQMNNVSTYAGLAPAVKDFQKIYGKSKVDQDSDIPVTSSVQRAVRDTFGKYGQKYIQDLTADLQGGRKREPSILSSLRGNAYQAALTLNLRVAMAQAGSYPTAAAEIGWKPLMQALAKGGEKGKPLSKADRELIAKHTPLLANRINGGHNEVNTGGNKSSVDISNLKVMSAKSLQGLNARILNKTAIATDWIAKVDAATVGRLWYACQYYVDAKNSSLEKGTDEYYQEVARVFNRVVERTQPSYTTMQRSSLLRNPNEAAKFFTMYMTQRAQNLNLVYDSVMEYHTLRQSGASEEKLKESRNKMGRVVSSQLAAGLTLSAMKIVADAIQHSMKGYRDDDDEVTLAKILEKLGLTWLESELSNVFFASEIYSAIHSMISQEPYYGINVNVIGTLGDFSEDIVKLANDPSGKTIIKTFKDAGTLLGIPATQMQKFYNMGKYWFEDIKDGGGIYSNSESGSSVKKEATKMVKQYLNGDMESYRKTREGLNGENASTVKSHIVTYLREQYVEDKLTDYEVRRVLESVYGMSSSNIDKKLEEFRQRKNGTYEKKESKKWGEE